MPNKTIDWSEEQKYVLEGRVVTMADQGTLPDGAIYIEAGVIKSVQSADDAPPAEFDDVLHVRTGDTIYPGLIDLHNHLCYNAMPLWDVPRKYTNNSQWKSHPDYSRRITKPSQVLGGTAGVAEALVRFVECRNMLGGITTSQGITLSSEPGITSLFRGLVRNVESPTKDTGLPSAGTRISNLSRSEAEKYLNSLKKRAGKSCYLQHLSEGTDVTARRWFRNLQLDSGQWAINDALCGIHSTALTEEDFEILMKHDGSIVFSPLSNFLLYGGTVDLAAAKKADVLVGIGCDWAPSGSKNLLGEMKVAWLVNEEHDSVYTARDIVSMATVNAAKILKWQDKLGSIEPGKFADFMVLNGQSGDDFMRVLGARETSISLVVIDGVPRVGQPSLMKRFKFAVADLEELDVGGSARKLYLTQEDAHPLVKGLSLGKAINELERAMANLPNLAKDLTNGTASGFVGGSIAGTAGVAADGVRVFLDFEEDLEDVAMAARPLTDFVTEPMNLPGITVPDDSDFLKLLVAARNLPEYVKIGLPLLYGEKIPLPPSARFMMEVADELHPQIMETLGDLRTFLRTWGELSWEQCKAIVDQAMIVLEQNYVHLPFKRSMHAIDPVQSLRLMRHRMERISDDKTPPEIDFHNDLVRIFISLRDLHTMYQLPRPFNGKMAFLPYDIEEYFVNRRRQYLATNLIGKPGPDSFKEGVEVTHWNGTPIDRIVNQNADRHAGSNWAARHARGLDSLTWRPLAQGLPPDDEWVTLRYLDDTGQVSEWTQDWLVTQPQPSGRSVDTGRESDEKAISTEAAFLGLDPITNEIQEARRVFYGGPAIIEEDEAIVSQKPREISNCDDGLDTYMPSVFKAREVKTPSGAFGHIRIYTFNVDDAGAFVDEFVRLVEKLPSKGLIIDVRGNGGGLIHAAEGLLQVLTPNRIKPQKAQFINSPLNLQLCRNHDPSGQLRGLDLKPWIQSIDDSIATGATYSLAFPITPDETCRTLGQRYYGPVVLITDALCYSATDMFAAGFKDHHIGTILGTAKNTGAGGANVWTHSLLRYLATHSNDGEPTHSPYEPLPHGAEIRVAIRRTLRVGDKAGAVVEDWGIAPDKFHYMTRNDVLNGNVDLINKAVRILADEKPHPMSLSVEKRSSGLPQIRVKTENIDRLDIFFNDRPEGSVDVREETTSLDLQEFVGNHSDVHSRLELRGYDKGALVAARLMNLNE